MTIKLSKQEQLAVDTAKNIITVGTAQAEIDKNCQAIRTARKGKALGTVKSGDAVMIRFTETLSQAGKSEQTVKNYATAFRKAVNDGVPFSMNAYRNTAKKGAKVSKANESKSIVKLSIVKDSPAESVSQGLRQAVEQYREQYAELVAFVIDALDEFDGE
jgi:membrane peptidoglycan carboxypeptidase